MTTVSPRLPGRLAAWTDEALSALGGVLFISRRRSGLFFLLALLSSPRHAAFGLAGLLVARLAARHLLPGPADPRHPLALGAGLLTGAALATYLPAGPGALFLLPATAALAALLVAVTQPLLALRGLPVLALPFVVASLVGLASATILYHGPLPIPELHPMLPGLEAWERWLGGSLPLWVQEDLRTFGSLLFLPSLLGGLLVVAGLLLGSRITALAMVTGGLLGTTLLRLLTGGAFHQEAFGLAAFNGILTAAALCGIFLALSLRSLVYTGLAVATSMLLATALIPLMHVAGLPVLALPFTLTVWLFLLPIRLGTLDSERLDIWAPPLHLVGRAEDNLRAFERWKRDRRVPLPVLSLPLRGVWTVSQGPGGQLTHNTILGSQAWDFMLLDGQGRGAEWPGDEVEQFHGYGCPVLAPADGIVVAQEGSLPDNPVHAVDTRNPWGNWLLLAHDSGTSSLLAHLQSGSLQLAPGQRVARGQQVALVGNSGRSPEPHLHLQLNAGPWLASPSLPAIFGSWVELPVGGAPVLHSLGRPEQGMRVCSVTDPDWSDWSAFFPYAVPGRRWRGEVARRGRRETFELTLRAGSGGRLILDDGFSTAQVAWWPGWVQILPLAEGDPERRRLTDRDSLVDWLLLVSSMLPCRGVDGLESRAEVRSHGLEAGWRRLLDLEADGWLHSWWSPIMDPLPGLEGRSEVRRGGKTVLRAQFRAEAHRGLVRLTIADDREHNLAEFRLEPMEARTT
jgi:urea transporter/murein DD-endopeptidase MepM/ murein hydrolase activator NlpD